MVCLVRLMLYSAILSPGFAQMTVFYFFSSRVKRNVPYGREVRCADRQAALLRAGIEMQYRAQSL